MNFNEFVEGRILGLWQCWGQFSILHATCGKARKMKRGLARSLLLRTATSPPIILAGLGHTAARCVPAKQPEHAMIKSIIGEAKMHAAVSRGLVFFHNSSDCHTLAMHICCCCSHICARTRQWIRHKLQAQLIWHGLVQVCMATMWHIALGTHVRLRASVSLTSSQFPPFLPFFSVMSSHTCPVSALSAVAMLGPMHPNPQWR